MQPGRAPTPGRAVAGELRQPERDRDGGYGGHHGNPRAQQIVGTAADPQQQDNAAGPEHDHVDRAGQEEEPARAPDDLTGGHTGEVKQPAAGGERTDAAAGQQRPGSHLRPRHLPRHRIGTGAKNSRKMTTKLAHEASSRATATSTSAGFIAAISRTTGRRSGTASSTVPPQTASTTTVSSRRRRSWRSSCCRAQRLRRCERRGGPSGDAGASGCDGRSGGGHWNDLGRPAGRR